uniref:Uncharacterized protein n=1 Tax=Acrobeloides nanus TaxID=290746 RepID=A0A914D995_9BILA
MVELIMDGKQEPKIEKLLAQYPVFTRIDQGKLRCNLTNHELPYKFETVQNYLTTKKFLWEWELHKILEENGQYFEDIGNNLFGCKITMKTISRDPKDLARHLSGKNFQKALAKKEQEAKNAEKEVEDEPMDINFEIKPSVTDEQNSDNSDVSDKESEGANSKKRTLTTKSAKKKVKRKRVA